MTYEPLIFLAVFPTVLVGQIYFLGVRMSKPEKMLREDPDPLTSAEKANLATYEAWLASANLEFRASYRFGAIRGITYQQKDQPRYFSFLFHQQRMTFSAESCWEGSYSLETSSSGSLGLFPRPGAYVQSFPDISAEEIWKRHLEGEEYINKKFGYPWVRIKTPFLEFILQMLRIKMQHVRSESFWPFRVLYRYFVTRHSIRNKTIMEQFP